jgi:uncharacterized protein (DUF433 family)
MAQVYTYYDANGEPEIVRNRVPAAGSGKVWARGRYSTEVRPSPLDVRVGRGIKIWELIRDLRSLNDEVDALLALHDPHLDRKDVGAALDYYSQYSAEIEQKLSEELAVA